MGSTVGSCWDQPLALAGINHRLLLGSIVGFCWDQPVTESTIERTNTCERWILGGLSVVLFLVFLFIYTHELTAHVRFFCHAANVAMLPHDTRVRLPILKNRAPTASMSYMSAMHDGDPRRVAQDNPWLTPWLTSLFVETKLNIDTIKTN
jgi:hypothetical protein